MLAKLNHVRMWDGADPIYEHHLMLGSVERAHAGVALVPHADVEQLIVDDASHHRHVIKVAPVHADEVHGAIPGYLRSRSERLFKKGPELAVIHLAGRHRELTMPTLGVGMAVDLHIVRRVHKRGVDQAVSTDDLPEEGNVAAIATADAVVAKDPYVPDFRLRLHRHGRDNFIGGIVRSLQHHVDLARGKTGQRQVEVDVEHGDLG